MADFKVGDVVVRVGNPRWHLGPNRPPPRLHPVRVDQVVSDVNGDVGLCFNNWPSNHILEAWWAGNYRRLPKADEQFTKQMRRITERAREKVS